MRTVSSLAVAAILLVGAASARAEGYGMAGCGLGSLIFTQNNILQVLAATTNGTSASQTFGITSGTSNCTAKGYMKSEAEQRAFAEVNLRHLERNVAAGEGEFLAAFADLLGCEASAKPTVYNVSQQSYERLFPRPGTRPDYFLQAIKTELKAHPEVAQSCTRL